MRATRVELRDFRNYERAAFELGGELTVVTGPNGAGKTNLLEGVYFACNARSPRTSNERELVRSGAAVARVVLETAGEEGRHRLELGFAPGEPKRLRIDGQAVDSLSTSDQRPLVSVFMPERLELVKGPPASRRAHLDRFVAACRPARAGTRAAYSRALQQRNALLGRVRTGAAAPASLDAWDAELARHGIELMTDRARAARCLAQPFASLAHRLGVPGEAELRYRPRSGADDATALAAELAERRESDLERGFTAHGPHRDEVQLLLGGRSLRAYGSQGQQRVAVLALLFAEREVLELERSRPPLMLLDDVMSELDSERRELLAELLTGGGQSIVTATDAEHVPDARGSGATLIEIGQGMLELQGAA